MGRLNTLVNRWAFWWVAAAAPIALAQATASPANAWSAVGNTVQLLGLPSPASGPVARVWFSEQDQRLIVRLPDGRVLSSTDGDRWTAEDEIPAPPAAGILAGGPEPESLVRVSTDQRVWYAGRTNVWRSDDGGAHWKTLTNYRGHSILGGSLSDLAVDSADPEHIVAATSTGVWVSMDGGQTWQGWNDGLPNLPVQRLYLAPSGSRGLRIGVTREASLLRELEWLPGQKSGWTEVTGAPDAAAENALKTRLTAEIHGEVTSAVASGESLFAGLSDGRLYASLDRGRNWRSFTVGSGAIVRLWSDPSDARLALAVSGGLEGRGSRVWRTVNGGQWWDDLTANLPEGRISGIAADAASGAIYLATSKGVFWTMSNLRAPAPETAWMTLAPTPSLMVRDVILDASSTTLYAAVAGNGLFSIQAPHRQKIPTVVDAADYTQKAAAPGSLLTVVGSGVRSATANRQTAPVLASSTTESQVQLPYSLTGDSVQVEVQSQQGVWRFPLTLKPAAPSVLVDHDGSPFVLDGDSGTPIDALHPLRPGGRLQILAAGLGRVDPEWPTGLAAPIQDPPRVVATVRVLLDGQGLEQTQATLAPGYVGYYLIEARVPDFLDAGAGELWIEVGGNASNRVRVYVDR